MINNSLPERLCLSELSHREFNGCSSRLILGRILFTFIATLSPDLGSKAWDGEYEESF